MRFGSAYRRSAAPPAFLALTGLIVASSCACAEPAEEEETIEGLLKSGWQIAGYTGAVDNWSTFILFRHPDRPYLVQCRTGYDVTREPHIKPHCYRLR